MKNFTQIAMVLILGSMISACQSPSKLLKKQKYDHAIERVIKRVEKGKSIDPEWRAVLEQAFASRIDRDMNRIKRLKRKNNLGNWDKVYQIAEDISDLQDDIDPYLPIYDEQGIRAEFEFVKTNAIMADAVNRSKAQYYAAANDLLESSRDGDKLRAREALGYLAKIERYDHSYKNSREMGEELKELAVTKIYFDLENRSRAFLPFRFKRALERFDFRDINKKWTVIDYQKRKGRKYDYNIVYQIRDIDVSPELLQETIIEEEKELESTDYKKDNRGDYILDSLGNKIEILRVETVRATVVKVLQNKEARIFGVLEIYDMKEQRRVFNEPVEAVASFEKESCTYQGDKRALSDNLPNLGPPVAFPDDEELLLELTDKLKPALRDRIRKFRLI